MFFKKLVEYSDLIGASDRITDRAKAIRKFLTTILSRADSQAYGFKIAMCTKTIRNAIVGCLLKGTDSYLIRQL